MHNVAASSPYRLWCQTGIVLQPSQPWIWGGRTMKQQYTPSRLHYVTTQETIILI